MKSILLIILSLFISVSTFAQLKDSINQPTEDMALALGFMHGGGGLIGLDVEFKIFNKLAIQGGIGAVSYGAGINYHLKNTLRSPFISLGYYHQGLSGISFSQEFIGPAFVYRAHKLFTASLGIGKVLRYGPRLKDFYASQGKTEADIPQMLLIYSIGLYFPVKD